MDATRRTPEPRPAPGPPGRSFSPWVLAALLFLLTFAGCRLFYSAHPLLYDNDAYFHLAVGRLYAHDGVPGSLPWLRFSLLGEGWGDKELLFHGLLAPFAAGGDAEAGGRTALALLDALVLTGLGLFCRRAVGNWGLLIPLWLVVAAPELTWRLVRLRPELGSLLLLLAATWAAGTRRFRLLGGIAALYALAYTAFQALLGLAVGWFVVGAVFRRRRDWALVVYPLLGVGVGLLVHPNFPANLDVWVVQNLEFFAQKDVLDVGTEILPQTTASIVLLYAGWAAGLAVVWRSWRAAGETPTENADQPEKTGEGLADATLVAAVAFGGLYLFMSRFALYMVPFATLAILFHLARRGGGLAAWTRLPGRGRVPLAVAVAAALLVAAPQAASQLSTFARRTKPGPEGERSADREAFGRAVPAGATVAAPWRLTPLYLFFAPQGRYLNALDPVFMAVPHPAAFAAQQAVFDGSATDVPLVVGTVLDSHFLAESTATASPTLLRRLSADPRVVPRYRGIHALWEIVPAAEGVFVLDWRAVPGRESPASAAAGAAYPRAGDARARALEGYVDARRVAPLGACATFVHAFETSAAAIVELELAPAGPTALTLDAEPTARIDADLGAVVGDAAKVPLALAAGSHYLTVTTCPERSPAARCGFYLLERRREQELDR